MEMTPTEKLCKLQRIFDGELKEMIQNAAIYIRYREGLDPKISQREALAAGRKAYEAVKKFNRITDSDDVEGEPNRIVDTIARGY